MPVPSYATETCKSLPIMKRNKLFAVLLHLVVPGLGHLYVRETIFGLFVLLISLIAFALFLVTLLFPVSLWAKFLLVGFPALFYLFTFIDLSRAFDRRKESVPRSGRATLIFAVFGLGYQLLVPIAPGNFLIRNSPALFYQEDNSLAPLYSRGDLLKLNRLAYTANLFFLDSPYLHTLPERYDAAGFVDRQGRSRVGIIIGFPGEEIEVMDGVVIIGGLPDYNAPGTEILLQGVTPLTNVDRFSILLVTLNFGVIGKTYHVPFDRLVGKVSKFL